MSDTVKLYQDAIALPDKPPEAMPLIWDQKVRK